MMLSWSSSRAFEPLRALLVVVAVVALVVVALNPTAQADGSSDPPTLVAATLAFSGQPADAAVGQAITSVPVDQDGDPVVVDVDFAVDADGLAAIVDGYETQLRGDLESQISASGGNLNPPLRNAIAAAVADADVAGTVADALDAALARLEVTIGIDRDPAGTAAEPTALLGATTVDVVDGAATFTDLHIDAVGRGYTLIASVPSSTVVDLSELRTGEVAYRVSGQNRIARASADPAEFDATIGAPTSDPSAAFTVWEEVVACEGAACAIGLRGDRLRTEITASTSQGSLALSATTEELCGDIDYRGLPHAVLFDSFGNDGAKVVTFVISRDEVQLVRDDGKSKYDICFMGDAPFTDKQGNAAPEADGAFADDDLLYGPALLPDCGTLPAPCIASRTGAPGGAAKIVVHLPPGDPWMR